MAKKKSSTSVPLQTNAPAKLPDKLVGTGAISADSIPKVPNRSLPTIAVDLTNLAMRFDGNGNTVAGVLQFYCIMPDAAVEAARVALSIDHLRGLIDLLTKATNYYPTSTAKTDPT